MSPEEAKKHIVEGVQVTRQQVTIAKAFILKNFSPNTSALIERFVSSVDAKMPKTIVLHASVDPMPTLKAASERFPGSSRPARRSGD